MVFFAFTDTAVLFCFVLFCFVLFCFVLFSVLAYCLCFVFLFYFVLCFSFLVLFLCVFSAFSVLVTFCKLHFVTYCTYSFCLGTLPVILYRQT